MDVSSSSSSSSSSDDEPPPKLTDKQIEAKIRKLFTELGAQFAELSYKVCPPVVCAMRLPAACAMLTADPCLAVAAPWLPPLAPEAPPPLSHPLQPLASGPSPTRCSPCHTLQYTARLALPGPATTGST